MMVINLINRKALLMCPARWGEARVGITYDVSGFDLVQCLKVVYTLRKCLQAAQVVHFSNVW